MSLNTAMFLFKKLKAENRLSDCLNDRKQRTGTNVSRSAKPAAKARI